MPGTLPREAPIIITRRWSGIVGFVETPTIDHRRLVHPAGEPLRHRDLDLPLILVRTPLSPFQLCGFVDGLRLDGNAIRATGTVKLVTDEEWACRLLSGRRHPAAIRVDQSVYEIAEDGELRLMEWRIKDVAIVPYSSWEEAGIFLVEEDPCSTSSPTA
jgi:hypothetical protein